MKKRMIAMLVMVMLLVGMLPVSALAAVQPADIYIATTGVDTNAGTEDAPVLSLNKALELVADGGTVHIVDSYTAEAGFVWNSHNKDVTITGGKLDLSNAYTQQTDGEKTRLCYDQADAVTYDNLELVFAEGAFYFANGNRLQVNENVTVTGGVKLFGGSFAKNSPATDVTLLGGSYQGIYGGGYKGHVTGDIDLYVGNVNPNYTVSHDGSTTLYGGGYNCNVYGDINLTIAGANVDYAYGSSHNSGIISGSVNVLLSGGNLYSLYGGGSGTIKGDINLSMTGGTVAQLFGANKKASYTGNVSVMLKGGTITRRFFGGCYNDYNTAGKYTEDTYVNGNVNVYLYEGMNLSWNTAETDRGFYAHSRHDPLFDAEVTTLYYMDAAAQTKHAGNVGSQSVGMTLAMGSASAADRISLYEMTAAVQQGTVILSDGIGVYVYINIPKVVADLSRLNITVAGQTQTVELSGYTPNQIGLYRIPVQVAPAQMTENITVQLVTNGTAGEPVSMTVQEYAQQILGGENEAAEKQTLVQHLLNYGAAAQQYFDVNADSLANNGFVLDYIAQLPEGYDTVDMSGQISGVAFYGASLVFESKLAVRFYFRAESMEGVTFTANGEPYATQEKDGMYYVEISNIAPQDYANVITLSAVKGEEALEVGYSPMHYIVRMYNDDNESLQALVNQLYGYYEASQGYVEEDQDLSDVIDWTATDSLPSETGKYRLTAPVTVSKATTTAKYAEIYLDLNGQTVTGTNNTRIYVVDEGADLTVTDTNENPGSIVCARESTADAGAIYVKGNGARFNLEGGTIDASAVSVNAGAAVYVAAGATFNMADGTITGGTATGNGGNIYVQSSTNDVSVSGTLNMTGGTVTGGKAAHGGNIYVAAGSTEDNKTAATFNMNGGTVTGGEATTVAGNVCALGVFSMLEGTISDGVCEVSGDHKYAANVYTRPGLNGCSFTVTGGTITGGVRVNQAGVITLGGTAKIVGGTYNLTFSAGTMETIGFAQGAEISVNYTEIGAENSFGTIGAAGDEQYIKADNGYVVAVTADGRLYLDDITLWTETDSLPSKAGKYRLTAPVNMAAATTVTGKEIYLDLNGQTVTGTNNNRIYVLNEGANLTIDDTAGGGKILCVRESTGNAGAIYLNKPSATFNLNGGTIDVSGTTVEYGAAVYVAAGNTFNMNGGTITGGTAKQGGNIYVAAGSDTVAAGEFHMTGGTVSGGEVSTVAGNVCALGVFSMTGGEIIDGVCTNTTDHKYAANVYTRPSLNGCSFTMTGGTIQGGVRVNQTGGSITLGGTAKIVGGTTNLTISAGTMTTAGFSRGAEISVNYTAYGVSNAFGTIGVAGDEKYIKADDRSVVAVEDGNLYLEEVTEWTSADSLPTGSGYYRLTAPVNVTAATTTAQNTNIYLDLNGQTVTGSNNARIYVLNIGSHLTIDDTATGGKIVCVRENTGDAGAIYVKSEGAVLTLKGGTIDASGVNVKSGAAVYVAANTTFNMNGGIVIGGTTTGNGGSIYVAAGATFNMNGGTITGGTATGNGGSIYVAAATNDVATAGSFTMNGGTVTGGTAVQGGNIYVAAGSSTKAAAVFTMNGGTVSGGEASTVAGNVAALGVFTMTGGEITGGVCTNTSDHKYATNLYTLPGKNGCTFTVTGGTIAGGIRVNNAGTVTLGGTAKITTDSNGYGMYVSTNGATIVVDADKPLTDGAEICLSATGNDPIIAGVIVEAYQEFFRCTVGTLSFDENGIHAVAPEAVVLDASNEFSLVSSKKA